MQFIRGKNNLILIICCVISLLPAIYFSFQKDGLFCDEIWTYGIANSTNHYALDPLAIHNQNNSGWITGKYFSDYLKVNTGEGFDYNAVIQNSKVDSHPALYYYILHTISSLFPNTFSKWFGLIPNILIFIIALVYFNKLCLLVFKKPWAYFVPTIWAISAAGINDVIFIRMYMLATLFSIMFTYYFWEFMCRKRFSVKNYFGLVITISMGILTEFTLIPYFGIIAILYLIFLGLKKEFKKAFSLLATAVIGIFLGNVLYPDFFTSLAGNLLGKQGYMDFAGKIKYQSQNVEIFLGHLNKMLFGGYFPVVLILFFGLVIGCIIKRYWDISIKSTSEEVFIDFFAAKKKKNRIIISTEHIACSIVLIAISFSFMLITRASNLNDNYGARVIYQLCPLVIFVLYYIFYKLCQRFECRKILAICFLSIATILSAASVKNFGILWLFKGYNTTIDMSQKDKDKDCIYLYSKSMWNDLYAPANVLENYNEIYFLAIEDLEQNLEPILKARKNNDPVILGFLTNIKDPVNTNNIFNTININNHYDFSFKYSLPYLNPDTAIVFYQLNKQIVQ